MPNEFGQEVQIQQLTPSSWIPPMRTRVYFGGANVPFG